MSLENFWTIFPFWIRAFALTLVMEVPIFVVLGKKLIARGGAGVTYRRLVIGGALGTCVTHPLLWFFWPLVVNDYTIYIVSGELVVAVIESLTFYLIARPILFRDAVVASLSANTISFGLGWIINTLISAAR